MGFNERKNNNNWRIAIVMLSSDIKEKGAFSIEMRSGEKIRSISDKQLVEYLDMEPFETTNDVINNVLHNLAIDHPRNPNSDKFWRGDIQDCYAMVKNIIYVHIMASTIQSPTLFGWEQSDWDDLVSGRLLLESYAEYKVFREALLCETERDMGYLYQKIMTLIYPQPSIGAIAIPICKYDFRR